MRKSVMSEEIQNEVQEIQESRLSIIGDKIFDSENKQGKNQECSLIWLGCQGRGRKNQRY